MLQGTYLKPDWDAPKNIIAFTTTRLNGYSTAPYDSFNLGDHVEDSPAAVTKNREKLHHDLQLEHEIQWLQQVHGIEVVTLPHSTLIPKADACISSTPNTVCAVLTADCLPILLCNTDGTEVAAIHAGWRGLLNGVIQNTIRQMQSSGRQLLAWLGPAISQPAFEVNHDIQQAFIDANKAYANGFLTEDQHVYGDLYQLARIALQDLGISRISGGQYCTYRDNKQFYSYRRDGGHTGRMASLIYGSNL